MFVQLELLDIQPTLHIANVREFIFGLQGSNFTLSLIKTY